MPALVDHLGEECISPALKVSPMYTPVQVYFMIEALT
jgi:hypothetical protein